MPANKDKVVIWPVYFDSTKARSKGRMVCAADSVTSPTIDDVMAAALKAGFKPEIEKDKKHPGTWRESSGRILVPKTEPKMAILKKIARSLKRKS
jgi:signal recognition particle subunit SRP19